MAKIGLTISVSGYTGKLLIVWREVIPGNPTPPETGRSAALDFPYENVFSINGINPAVHIVELWRSSAGVSLDELIKRWEIDPSMVNVGKYLRFQYQVDRGEDGGTVGEGDYWEDPGNGDTELTDERLIGAIKSELRVHEAGYGDKLDAEYEILPGGGISLNNGATFNQGTAWFIEREIFEQVPAVITTAAPFADVEILTADDDFYTDSTENYYNKLVIVNGSGPVVTMNFQSLAAIPSNTKVTFNTHQGAQNYLKLAFDTGDTVNFLGQAKNVIYLAKCEEISLFFKDGVCYVSQYNGKALYRGKVHADMDSSRSTDTGAFILADEATGELNEADYPGLYEFIENLPVGHSVPLGSGSGQWSESQVANSGQINEETIYPNKSMFGIDTVAKKFRVPHLKNLSRRFVTTGQYPGRYQHDAVQRVEVTATMLKGYSYTAGPNNAVVGNGHNNSSTELKQMYLKFDTGNPENVTRNFGETPFIIL